MALDKIEAIRAFCTIVEAGGFSRAAEQLGIAKTTISGQVQALEAQLGVTLLHRSTRRVSPTTDGLAYYEVARSVVEQFDELNLLLTQGGRVSGSLTIEAPATVGSYLLIPALNDFQQRYPDIQLAINCSERAVDLIGEQADCALRGGPVNDSDLVCKPMGLMRFCLCATPSYLASAPKLEQPSDLEQHRFIGFRFPVSNKLYACKLRQGEKEFHLSLTPELCFNNADVYFQAGLAGLGIMNTPRAMAQPYLERGELIEVLVDWQVDSMPISLVFPYTPRRSARLQAFIDWAQALFASHELWRLSK